MIKNFKFKNRSVSGFTLVELLIGITIVVLLAIAMVASFNSVGVFNKARDAQRKKDLTRIKVAFEEYYSDTECYPSKTIADNLNTKSNCKSNVFAPWLPTWPCDPSGNPYWVEVENPVFSGCNKWFKILTNLENRSDDGIPFNWSYSSDRILSGEVTEAMANYGVSSSNINWYDEYQDPECAMYGGCYYKPDPVDSPNVCNSAGTGCIGPNCYIGICKTSCVVECCGRGCN